MLQAKSKRESYSSIAGNNIAVPNPGSEGAHLSSFILVRNVQKGFMDGVNGKLRATERTNKNSCNHLKAKTNELKTVRERTGGAEEKFKLKCKRISRNRRSVGLFLIFLSLVCTSAYIC